MSKVNETTAGTTTDPNVYVCCSVHSKMHIVTFSINYSTGQTSYTYLDGLAL